MLEELLGVGPGITALVGSGGKSTLLALLAGELAAAGARVLCATTTHMFPPAGMPLAEDLPGARALLDRGGPVCAGAWAGEGKLVPPPGPLRDYRALCDCLLVEADGARRLPLKAHAPHEPVVPEHTERTILVVGASGLYGRVGEVVHRPEIFCALTGCTPADAATPERVARAIWAEGLGDLVLINQVDAAPQAARELAALLGKGTVLAALSKGEWRYADGYTGGR